MHLRLFGNRKRRNPLLAWTRNNLGLLSHALVGVHHTVVGGHHFSVDSRSYRQVRTSECKGRYRVLVGCATREASDSSRPATQR